MEDELVKIGAAALGGTGVSGGVVYLFLSNWLKRAEERFKEVHELRGKMSTLTLQVHNLERESQTMKTDLREALRSVTEQIGKLDEKFDRFLERFYGARRDD